MSQKTKNNNISIKDFPIIEVNIDDLKPDSSNPNSMTLEQERGLEKSMINFGRLKYIVVDQDLNVIDGAHRINVEKAIGTSKVQVIQVNVKDEIERKILRETLNKLHGEYNKEKESSELLQIFESQRLDELAELLAQPKQELENLISRYNPDIHFEREEDESKLPSLYDTESFVKSGEIWQLGRHRLMCADCGDNNSISQLFQNSTLKANLLILDPPYNTNFTEWDNIPEYMKRLQEWITLYQDLLDEKGSCYIFHNDIPTIARLMMWIETNTKFIYHQFIVWNKMFQGMKFHDYLHGINENESLRNYKKFAEYILFYTFQDETGLSKVMLDMNNFQTLRKYFKDLLNATKLSKIQIMNNIGQSADHCFRFDSTQWDLPTPQTYKDLISLVREDSNFKIKPYSELRQEYEELRQEYESQRYTFNNQETHHSVWNYDLPSKDTTDGDHPTPKPVELIMTILKYSSNENNIILDPFLGSGSTLIACEQTNRICYGCEIDSHYCSVICQRFYNYTNIEPIRVKDGKTMQQVKMSR